MSLQPIKKYNSVITVQRRDGPPIELTAKEVNFCLTHNFWPGRMELTVRLPSLEDCEMAETIQKKCNCKVIYTN